MSFPSVKEQIDLIKRNTVEIIPEDELVRKIEKSIKENKPLRVKLGCDPSRPDLHIGHGVVLQKLRDFQDLGHKAILIIGDFTAMIGDPSGKNKTRPALTLEETRINGKTYFEQASKILNTDNLDIKYNSEWLDKMTFGDVIKLASKYTVAQILERDDFTKRMEAKTPISLHELLYPLSQAMDSVAIESDVELGGTDQTFNLLVGRAIQEAYGQPSQCIVTCELLEGTDGVEKMSKSMNNAICFTDSPKDIFGKSMSIPDKLIFKYYTLATMLNDQELAEIKKELEDPKTNPRNLKVRLGYELVKKYYDEESAKYAKNEFETIFVKKEIPDGIPEIQIEHSEIYLVAGFISISKLLKDAGIVASTSEAIRLLKQGAISIGEEKLYEDKYLTKGKSDFTIKVGKRKFLKVKV